MTNTAQDFKVGDKFVVTKESFRQQGYTHVYVVTDVTTNRVYFNHNDEEALVYKDAIEKCIEPQKHIHHDLIVAWVKDPKGCVIQYFNRFLVEWKDTDGNSPSWNATTEYRIKPMTKEVQRWKYLVEQSGSEFFVPRKHYTEDEVQKEWHFSAVSLTKLEQTLVTTVEEA